MNSDFKERALQAVDPKTVWNAETDSHHSHTPGKKRTAADVLGYEPVNRHDRRKARKLLKAR